MKNQLTTNKYFLYATEFFAGMSVMAVELGASRLLAPYFSSSQIVWTIIIGTIMIAMALGNIYGGKCADKNPDPKKLYGRIAIAAIWIALIPLLGKYVILGISGLLILTISSGFLIVAAFIACMVIFVVPLFLLGTVTPSLARYTMDSVDDSGRIVGTLGAYNTIGSIIGTFLPTFVTIPSVGTSITFLIFAAILLLISILYFVTTKQKSIRCVVGLIVLIITTIFGAKDSFAFWEDNLLYEGESVYNYLQVKDNPNSVVLSTNVLFGVQSILMKDAELTGMYYDYAMAAPLMARVPEKEAPKMLVLGMGTGTYAKQCRKYFPNMQTTGVEIDEKITDLAGTYFELPDDIPVVTYDGRAYLNADQERYDVILVDAYQDITIPFQMSGVEFFKLVAEHLTPDGVMVVNMNMQTDEPDNICDYLEDTIASVFPYVYTVDVAGNTNCELFASADPKMTETCETQTAQMEENALKSFMQNRVFGNLVAYEGGDRILTDDKAPVELLGIQVIDSIIQREVVYYQDAFREKGLDLFFDGNVL
ncbi:MAG: fused MFS/spermidine synthase [Lachnospiraceae bacterium]|nr:fused MFS/spermidine synthase [Lachnospiraceae bacterium]